MQDVEVAFEAETLSELDEVAVREFDGDREVAVRALLGEWLATRDEAE